MISPPLPPPDTPHYPQWNDGGWLANLHRNKCKQLITTFLRMFSNFLSQTNAAGVCLLPGVQGSQPLVVLGVVGIVKG